MSEKLSISLVNLRFWAYHGVFPEEKVLGNWFILSLVVGLKKNKEIEELHHTIDYGTLYEIVKQSSKTFVTLSATVGVFNRTPTMLTS